MLYPTRFDVIVVGGGHAGTEAALAAARAGANTLLLTHNLDTLGAMSCNPSIGGIGKGHLVREVDALGGAMAAATDEAGIQFRILNASKGPAVRATRAQADRVLYKQAIRGRLENQPNLTIFAEACDDLIVEGERVAGAVTQLGIRFMADAVVLTAGTFLNGKIHVGLENYTGGRMGDPPSNSLASRLKELNLPQGRLKTGTPPRLDGKTIDFSVMEEQHSDNPMPVFSFLGNAAQHPRQLPCWITETNENGNVVDFFDHANTFDFLSISSYCVASRVRYDAPLLAVGIEIGNLAQGQLPEFPFGFHGHRAIGQEHLARALEVTAPVLDHAAHRGQLHEQRHGLFEAQLQGHGDAPHIAAVEHDRAAHRFIHDAADDAAMHAPRVALVNLLAAEARQHRAVVLLVKKHLHPGDVLHAADETHARIRLLTH